ncbi:hypothetical protein FNYG_06012 [Fusarium nygamai]|uniref:Carrier domain-containing protein n=1 Tax=Gibberella nygamai TaxID=42673 RepID=A0A2K0WDQ6_GIBNY|nr:hypothetical protein FNYG_06012 [Fusarium nygamai]
MRNENPDKNLATILLGSDALHDIEQTSHLIYSTFSSTTGDKEYVIEDGVPWVTRYSSAIDLDVNIANQFSKTASETMRLGDTCSTLQVSIQQPGVPETLRFEPVIRKGDLAADEVEIEPRAFGVNSQDILTVMGHGEEHFFGREGSGIVLKVGTSVTYFAPGDRVYYVAPESFRTRLSIKASYCHRIPDALTFADAASIPVAFVTALSCTRDLGRLQAGERILIHSAASDIGQACIQLAMHYNAEVFIVTECSSDAELLRERYGIENDHIFTNCVGVLAERIRLVCGGGGIDIVINFLSGESVYQSCKCLAPFGRFIQIGHTPEPMDFRSLQQGTSFTQFSFDLLFTKSPAKIKSLMVDIEASIAKGVFKPVFPLTHDTATNLPNAIHAAKTKGQTGKTVITIGPEDTVSVHPSVRNTLRLNPNATYILVGGLGGIGRSVALHMAKSGAKHLAFLSRSGASDKNAKGLDEDLEKLGASTVFHTCDIGDPDQVRDVLEQYDGSSIPRIAGCIQAAMVLRDGIFENMTHDDFKTSLRPKIRGSWNLHQFLPHELDFFILLSSISGVTGNPGQANYAAGNSFMDSLAHYRRQQGLVATSIDLGLMLDVGFVAEGQGTSNLKKWETVGIYEEELLLLMSVAMRGQLPDPGDGVSPEIPAQIVTGLATGRHVAEHSLDQPFYFSDPRFKQLVTSGLEPGSLDYTDKSMSLRAALGSSTSLAQASYVITDTIKKQLARIMDKDVENIEAGKPLHTYGVDSLSAVEIRNWLAKDIQSEVGIFDILGSPSILSLADKVTTTSKLTAHLISKD